MELVGAKQNDVYDIYIHEFQSLLKEMLGVKIDEDTFVLKLDKKTKVCFHFEDN